MEQTVEENEESLDILGYAKTMVRPCPANKTHAICDGSILCLFSPGIFAGPSSFLIT